MKLAIVLRGISYYNGDDIISNSKNIDYRECIESFRNNLVSQLKKRFDIIDIYLVTYETEMLGKIIEDYKPKNTLIYDRDAVFERKTVNILMSDAIRLINPKEYDNVLLTRFDLYFYKPFPIHEVNLEKIVFGWKGEVGQCDDNFVLFPSKYSESLKIGLSQNYAHGINYKFSPEECMYLSTLDPDKGYHFPDFYIFQRNISEYKSGNMKLLPEPIHRRNKPHEYGRLEIIEHPAIIAYFVNLYKCNLYVEYGVRTGTCMQKILPFCQ